MIDKKSLKKKAKGLDPILRIGKRGMTEGVIIEIKKLLKRKHLIKIKVLNNCSQKKSEIIEFILSQTEAELISDIGNVFTLYRKKIN